MMAKKINSIRLFVIHGNFQKLGWPNLPILTYLFPLTPNLVSVTVDSLCKHRKIFRTVTEISTNPNLFKKRSCIKTKKIKCLLRVPDHWTNLLLRCLVCTCIINKSINTPQDTFMVTFWVSYSSCLITFCNIRYC